MLTNSRKPEKVRFGRAFARRGWTVLIGAAIPTLAGAAFAQWPATINLASPPPSSSVSISNVMGSKSGDHLGSEPSHGVAFGDFDDDGLDELIIGAPGADPNNRNGAGECVIQSSRRIGSGFRSANNTRHVMGAASGDRLGISVASGDINGDGADDVIIGADKADTTSGVDSGCVYVVYGGNLKPGGVLNLSQVPASVLITRILGANDSDWAGRSVASGDINDDGYDDVVIGSPGADADGRTNAGTVHVVYGGPGLPGSTIALSGATVAGQTLILGGAEFDGAGAALACGNFNGDGYEDVALGAPAAAGDPLPAGAKAGRVSIIYGENVNGGNSIDLADDPTSNGSTLITGNLRTDQLGFSLAAGNLDNDGFDDLAIGAPGATWDDDDGVPEERMHSGAAFVIWGRGDLSGDTLTMSDAPGTHGETRVQAAQTGGMAGAAVAVGDVNGDGNDDLLLGAWRADAAGKTDAGTVHVFYGGGDLVGVNIDMDVTSPDSMILGKNAYDAMGTGLDASGDSNGDGINDLLVAAFFADSKPFADNQAGVVTLILGKNLAP